MGSTPPGSMGLPVIGETPAFLRNPFRFLEERQRRYGDVFRSHVLFRRVVFLAGVEGAEAFYDAENITRADAHPFPLVDLFGGQNMEMFDGPRHLALKTIALGAFDERAIVGYLPDLQHTIESALMRFADVDEIVATAELQRLAIEAIWGNLMGFPPAVEADRIARDYGTVLHGITSIPVPISGTPYAKARAARDRLLERIADGIRSRRMDPTNDGLSQMLQGATPDGSTMSDREALLEVHHIVIAGFIVYLLMVEVLRRLAENPSLLERCRSEILTHASDGEITVETLERLTTCTNVVREAKRIVPLVPLAFGRARRGFRCASSDVPADWTVYLALHLLNHDPRIFRHPERFDPDRFSPPREEQRGHPMAFIPQGAEPPTGHRCLGVDYSTTAVLMFMTLLLRSYTWSLPPQDLSLNWRTVPPEPRDGLRVRVRRDPAVP